jgi:hypothetical protein
MSHMLDIYLPLIVLMILNLLKTNHNKKKKKKRKRNEEGSEGFPMLRYSTLSTHFILVDSTILVIFCEGYKL